MFSSNSWIIQDEWFSWRGEEHELTTFRKDWPGVIKYFFTLCHVWKIYTGTGEPKRVPQWISIAYNNLCGILKICSWNILPHCWDECHPNSTCLSCAHVTPIRLRRGANSSGTLKSSSLSGMKIKLSYILFTQMTFRHHDADT